MTTLVSDIVLVKVIAPIRRKSLRVTTENLMKSLHTTLNFCLYIPVPWELRVISPDNRCVVSLLLCKPTVWNSMRAVVIFAYYLNNILILHIQVDLNFNY
jgi:hypothetical protein